MDIRKLQKGQRCQASTTEATTLYLQWQNIKEQLQSKIILTLQWILPGVKQRKKAYPSYDSPLRQPPS